MIKKITIRDVACYDHEGCAFEDLKKVNIIYGGNGTGKTTISKVLGSDSLRYDYPQCEVEWDGEEREVYVFNKDFREKNIKESIPGVFSIGGVWLRMEKPKEIHKKFRDENVEKVNCIKGQLHEKEMELSRVEATLCNDLWEKIYIPHQDFKECLKGYDKKNSFSKRLIQGIKDHTSEFELRSGRIKSEVIGMPYEEWAGDRMTDIEEMRRLYHQVYEGEYGQIGMDHPLSNWIMNQRATLRSDLWYYMSEKAYDYVVKAESEMEGIELSLKRLRRELGKAMDVIKSVEMTFRTNDSQMPSLQPSIDSINRSLREAMFSGFSIQPSPWMKAHYQIQREDGSSVSDSLSEGEETFIAFLYMMQLVREGLSAFDERNPRVVVVDDPICSLDSQTLYAVSDMLNDLIKEVLAGNSNIEQVIILTHNTEFHRLLSQRKRNDQVHYYKIFKRDGVSRVLAYGINNPMKSEYEMQWEALRALKAGHSVPNAPNAMRKILEAYFVRLGGYDKRRLVPDNFTDNDEERIIATSLMKWMDEGSHSVRDGLYMGDIDETNWRYLKVFKRFFEKMGHGAHYEMMMREH